MNPNLEKLPSGWAKTLADLYQEGASDTEVKAKLRMTHSLWDTLYNDPLNSEFKEVVDFGRMLAKAWWLSQGRLNLKNKQFNGQLWYMNMKNLYGWSEKTETATKAVEGLTSEELDERIKNAMAKVKRSLK